MWSGGGGLAGVEQEGDVASEVALQSSAVLHPSWSALGGLLGHVGLGSGVEPEGG